MGTTTNEIQFETSRLIIRPLKRQEIPALYQLMFSPFVLKFNMLEKISYADFEQEYQTDDSGNLYLIRKTDGRLLGQISLQPDTIRFGVKSLNLSYWLGADFAQQGYMKEALAALIPILFQTHSYELLTARVFSPNLASQKLLAGLGFQREAYLKHAVRNSAGTVFDDIFYVLFNPSN